MSVTCHPNQDPGNSMGGGMESDMGILPMIPSPATSENHGQDAYATLKETHGQDAHATPSQNTPHHAIPDHGQDAHATSRLRIRRGANLPHWVLEGAPTIYEVNFRLGDSLPQNILVAWLEERHNIIRTAQQMKRPLSPDEERRLQQLFSEKVETYLDAGHGDCWLRRPDIAEIVKGALEHFHEQRYLLIAWCIMPNHVHVLFEALPPHEPPNILHSWKSFTANQSNKRLGRTGEFWQSESYDHIIRNKEELEKRIDYVRLNPDHAGLKNWPWVYISLRWHGHPAHE